MALRSSKGGTGDYADVEMSSGATKENQHQEVVDFVKGDMLGEEPESKFKTLFYRIDPFQGEQMIRAPKHFHSANIYCGFLYWICILLFAISAFSQHLTRPVIETYSMIPSYSAPTIPIHVSLSCDPTGWGCASCNGTWVQPGWNCVNGSIAFSFVQESYLNTKAGYCEGISSDTTLHPSTSSMVSPTRLNLTACYSSDFADGILIDVPFSAGYAEDNAPRMVVTITSPLSPDLFYEQHLEPAQRKSVFLGQTNYYNKVDDSEDTQTYVSDLFYDGKNGNSNAQLRIKVAQLSTISEKTKPGTVFDVFAAVGGFATILFPVATFLKQVLLTMAKGGLCTSFSENAAKIFLS